SAGIAESLEFGDVAHKGSGSVAAVLAPPYRSGPALVRRRQRSRALHLRSRRRPRRALRARTRQDPSARTAVACPTAGMPEILLPPGLELARHVVERNLHVGERDEDVIQKVGGLADHFLTIAGHSGHDCLSRFFAQLLQDALAAAFE